MARGRLLLYPMRDHLSHAHLQHEEGAGRLLRGGGGEAAEPFGDARGGFGGGAVGVRGGQWGRPRPVVAPDRPKPEVYKLARKSYFAALDEGAGGFQAFVPTAHIVLGDTLGRLRGFYDGTDLDEVNRLVRDVQFALDRP